MKNKTPRQIIDKVDGLLYLAEHYYPDEMQSAWKVIASYGTKPWKTISCDKSFSWQDLIDQWNKLFAFLNLENKTGELLVSVGGFANTGAWQQVKYNHPALLLDISVFENEPELIVMDRYHQIFAAITTEENEYLLFAARRFDEQWLLISDDIR